MREASDPDEILMKILKPTDIAWCVCLSNDTFQMIGIFNDEIIEHHFRVKLFKYEFTPWRSMYFKWFLSLALNQSLARSARNWHDSDENFVKDGERERVRECASEMGKTNVESALDTQLAVVCINAR